LTPFAELLTVSYDEIIERKKAYPKSISTRDAISEVHNKGFDEV